MDVFDSLFAANRRQADAGAPKGLPAAPARRLAVLCCMDARIDVHAALGLAPGDAHVIRNAGGLVTEDAVRSLALSVWAFGTDSVLLIQHTNCGLERLDEAALGERIRKASGAEPPGGFGRIDDLRASVATAVETLRSNPMFKDVQIRGAIYDVDTALLNELA